MSYLLQKCLNYLVHYQQCYQNLSLLFKKYIIKQKLVNVYVPTNEIRTRPELLKIQVHVLLYCKRNKTQEQEQKKT